MKVKIFLLLVVVSISILPQQEKVPLWAKGVVWYQIFSERFANGDTSNDPEAEKVFVNNKNTPEDWTVTKWTSNWFAHSDWGHKTGGKNNHHY